GTKEAGVKYPRTLTAVGEPPPQYPGEEEVPEVDADLLPLADEVAKVCAAHDEKMDDETSMDAESLSRALELEARLRQVLRQRPQQVAAFDDHCDYLLDDWLSDVIFDLAESGRGDEAFGLHTAWLELLGNDAEGRLGSRAKLLLSAGRKEEAKAEAEHRLQS